MIDEQEWLLLNAEKKALEIQVKAAETQRDELARSASFQFGLLIKNSFLRPGMHTLRLPIDLYRLLRGTLPLLSGDREVTTVDACPLLPMAMTDYQLTHASIVRDGAQRPLTIACILDSLTAASFAYEANLLMPTPGIAWKAAFEEHSPDLFFVESYWQGNDRSWGKCSDSSEKLKALFEILNYCKEKSIPTVFWNKEDPVSFEIFAPIAQFFDHVFTSDANTIARYAQEYSIQATALSFAASPAIHNPLEKDERVNEAVFAGRYFRKYPDRCRDFDFICNLLESLGIDYVIYDRNANLPAGTSKITAYPDKYRSKILRALPPSEMWRVNKGYKYQINVNSVQNSPTMFARRVYEALASGAIVLSNYSLGVEELFGDTVLIFDEKTDSTARLEAIRENDRVYHGTVINGVRAVFDKHTYAHRLKDICDVAGIDAMVAYKPVVAVVDVTSEEEFRTLREHVENQLYPHAQILVRSANEDHFGPIYCGDQRSIIAVDGNSESHIILSLEQLAGRRCLSDIAYGLSDLTGSMA